MIDSFVDATDIKVKSRVDINFGLEHYFSTISALKDAVIKMLQDEAKFCSERLYEMEHQRDYLIEQIAKQLGDSEKFMATLPSKESMSRSNALKTIRKINHFGSEVVKADFEWPSATDLLAMPENEPIRVCGFNWTKSEDGKAIAGIQVILSSGKTSDLFLAKNAKADNIERININPDQVVKKIKAQQGMNSNVNDVYFFDSKDALITQMVASHGGGYDTVTFGEGEELLGVYGTKNRIYDHFDTLGFIVWKPSGFMEQ